MIPMMLRTIKVMLTAMPAFAPELSPLEAGDDVGVCVEEGRMEEASSLGATTLDGRESVASDLTRRWDISERRKVAILAETTIVGGGEECIYIGSREKDILRRSALNIISG